MFSPSRLAPALRTVTARGAVPLLSQRAGSLVAPQAVSIRLLSEGGGDFRMGGGRARGGRRAGRSSTAVARSSAPPPPAHDPQDPWVAVKVGAVIFFLLSVPIPRSHHALFEMAVDATFRMMHLAKCTGGTRRPTRPRRLGNRNLLGWRSQTPSSKAEEG